MTTFRATARLSLAAVALVFGASFAAAKDKTPAKPDPKPHAAPAVKHTAPAVKPHPAPSPAEKRQHEPLTLAKPPAASQVQGHKLDDAKKPNKLGDTGTREVGHKHEDAKKPSNFSFGASNPSTVKDAAKSAPEAKKPDGFTYQKIESVKSARESGSGMATGKTKPPMANQSGNVPAGDGAKGAATTKPIDRTSDLEASTQKGGEKNKKVLKFISGLVQIFKGNTDEGYDNSFGQFHKNPVEVKPTDNGTPPFNPTDKPGPNK